MTNGCLILVLLIRGHIINNLVIRCSTTFLKFSFLLKIPANIVVTCKILTQVFYTPKEQKVFLMYIITQRLF